MLQAVRNASSVPWWDGRNWWPAPANRDDRPFSHTVHHPQSDTRVHQDGHSASATDASVPYAAIMPKVYQRDGSFDTSQISQKNRPSDTLLALWPHTGRTHQLRMHCAHPDGLGCPIVGDELYGKKADRLYLQAQAISFVHPTTGQKMHFELPIAFSLDDWFV